MAAKNEVDAFVRDSQNAFSFDSASLCSCCNRLISFCSPDIFSFSSGCLSLKPQASWEGQGGEVHLGLAIVCPGVLTICQNKPVGMTVE